MNIYAIGDIHGCLGELTSLHKKIFTNEEFNPKEDLIVYLGDYIDRGKNSKGVINQILKLKNNKIKTINLMGNHDEFMINFLFNKNNNIKDWLNFGADQTFKSYNIEIVEFIKDGFGDDVINVNNNSGRADAFVRSSAEGEFNEYQFSVDELEQFTGFQIKVVMSGTNEAKAPRFKDLRVIALA